MLGVPEMIVGAIFVLALAGTISFAVLKSKVSHH